MTAPSLLLLGPGGPDPRTVQVSHALRDALLELRPGLDVACAYLDHTRLNSAGPSASQAIGSLVRNGVEEVVVVPLLLSDAFGARAEVPALVAQARSAHPQIRLAASRPIGPEAQLLAVVDRRLRDALRASHANELDGLVFSAAGSNDLRSNAIVARRARQWAAHHRLPCVTAFAQGSGPTTAEAIRTLRVQGRRHIAVGSWFLAPGVLYTRQSELALDAGAIAVADPLGGEPEIAEVVLNRYVVAAMDLVDLEDFMPEAEDDLAEPAPVRHLAVVGA